MPIHENNPVSSRSHRDEPFASDQQSTAHQVGRFKAQSIDSTLCWIKLETLRSKWIKSEITARRSTGLPQILAHTNPVTRVGGNDRVLPRSFSNTQGGLDASLIYPSFKQ